MLITYIRIEAVRPRHDKKYINNTSKEIEIDLKPGEKRRQELPMVKRGITECNI